jgi:hypothetical protein
MLSNNAWRAAIKTDDKGTPLRGSAQRQHVRVAPLRGEDPADSYTGFDLLQTIGHRWREMIPSCGFLICEYRVLAQASDRTLFDLTADGGRDARWKGIPPAALQIISS